MSSKFRPASLLGVGAIAGAILSMGITAMAQRDTRGILPLDELRQFSDVFGAIKAYYVEPVEDRKLITEAISGMVTGLDPHSTYLDADAFRELQVGTQGEFGGLGIEVGTELAIPINHFEGNYTCEPETLAELQADDRIVFRYVDNPNGSTDDIAGVCSAGRNVVGLMPHPERASHPLLGSTDGVPLLRSLLVTAGALAA